MKIVGHRGARGLAAENTLAGIRKALEFAVDEIEVDVRVTSDGVPVLNHDSWLAGTDGRMLIISSNTYQELKKHQPDLCRLKEAIRVINRQAVLNIEVKQRVLTAPIAAELSQHLRAGWQESDFMLGSKSQRTLRELHQALPEIQKIVIARFLSIWARHRARQVGARRLTMNQYFVWFGFISIISRNYDLFVYTLNDPAKARRWEKHGLAGVVTDRPDLYRRSKGKR